MITSASIDGDLSYLIVVTVPIKINTTFSLAIWLFRIGWLLQVCLCLQFVIVSIYYTYIIYILLIINKKVT